MKLPAEKFIIFWCKLFGENINSNINHYAEPRACGAMSGGNPLEVMLGQYRQLQQQLTKMQSSQSQATTLICENEMVLKELDLLETDAHVFKLIGPVLVKQELVEVKSNVSKRIEYIKSDITRLEGNLKAKNTEQEELREKISKLQKGGS